MSNSYTLNWLSREFGLPLQGDAEAVISGIGTLRGAASEHISFLSNPAYRRELQDSHAGAVILSAAASEDWDGNALISEDPYVDYARIAALFDNRPAPQSGVHASAAVDAAADVAATAAIGPNAVVAADCRIGPGVVIGAGGVIEAGVTIGAQSRIGSNVTLCHGVTLGKRVICHPGVVIGADGFGLAFDRDHWIKVPQLGSVVIGDDCEIGANSTVDRGAIEDTVLEQDVRLDNQVQIAHNVFIGAHTAMAGCVGIAGSTRIGRYCMFAGGSGAGGHVEIADHVVVKAMTMVTRTVRQAGEYAAGLEAQPNAQWQKNHARIRKLDALVKRLLRLERELKHSKD